MLWKVSPKNTVSTPWFGMKRTKQWIPLSSVKKTLKLETCLEIKKDWGNKSAVARFVPGIIIMKAGAIEIRNS